MLCTEILVRMVAQDPDTASYTLRNARAQDDLRHHSLCRI